MVGVANGPRLCPRRDTTMALSDRLHHDVEVAERASVAVAIGLVLTAFLALAVGAAVYDIGKWLTVW